MHDSWLTYTVGFQRQLTFLIMEESIILADARTYIAPSKAKCVDIKVYEAKISGSTALS
jgi:hypothetical protein